MKSHLTPNTHSEVGECWTYGEDLVPAEAERPGLFVEGERCLECRAGRRGSRGVRVTLGDQPVTHDALEIWGEVPPHLQNELFKRLLRGFTDASVMVLEEENFVFNNRGHADSMALTTCDCVPPRESWTPYH